LQRLSSGAGLKEAAKAGLRRREAPRFGERRSGNMRRGLAITLLLATIAGSASAQDHYYGGEYYGAGAACSSEPLYPYDDLEPWKHGYVQVMPFYGGFHFYRPYNYKQVFAQSQTAAGWGMPNTMPYSQQFWHRYEQQADLSLPRVPQTPAYQPGYAPQTNVESQPWYFPLGAVPTQPEAHPASYSGPVSPAPQLISAPESTQARAMREYLQGPALP
jgi:hypothetical protein